ncbi:tripartite tricarboxylate transporter permease [Bacillus benzoevorans]|uniref:Putative tricarboxylic transport membrane protein n=1 Tax=Bacillus benzoevorans TaxID=1456 RepID=A0A7X0HRV3_9BACI|nr:tripartite tricarboxylate transporter permease [Bacillus benzoevorans]MBB6444515.1 putative tricarboxylic transport membrane protein [Bacillus benzoevorans]
MDSLMLLLQGFETALTWSNLLYCLIGVMLGMFIGVLPGLGPVSGTALLIPITFGMEPVSAIIMLSGIFYGSMYGGTITSVLVNVPGEAASVITCIDGYEMTKKGRAGTALGVSAIGSFIGGIVAVTALTFVGPALSKFALKFGPPEFFAIMLLGMLMIVALMGKSLVRGLIAAVLGLLLAMVGQDMVTGEFRFTFGSIELMDGIDFAVMAMGLFGISEILLNAENPAKVTKPEKVKGLLPNREEWGPTLKSVGRGTGIGMLLGVIPGANSIIASTFSYILEKKVAKDPSRFGKGAIEGVAGPETANNAHSGAALIPLFSLGLPSSPTMAVILGAFIMHGLTPGPALFTKNPDFVWGLIASMFIGNVLLLIMNMPLVGMWAKIAMIPYKLLFPIILMVILVGTYSLNGSLWDVGLMLIFGVIGYILKKLDIPMSAMIVTFILGSQLETSMLQSLSISTEGFLIFFTQPISAAIMGIALIIFAISVYSGVKNKRGKLADDVEI